MGIRTIDFVNGEYYHVFNRGVDKRIIFTNKNQQYFFFRRLKILNTIDSSKRFNNQRNKHKERETAGHGEQLVSIVAYCLLPNHFHLLLKQNVDNGISKFMQRLGTSYTMFFNNQEKRTGGLFQGKFKATHLSGEYALPSVSTYVNLNYKHHGIDPKMQLAKSSLFEYLNTELGENVCDKNEISEIIEEVGGLNEYKNYLKQASISFADNKNINLSLSDFEF
jgi:REP element-mobilizing transposase RayT